MNPNASIPTPATDPLGLGNFNDQALHPDENSMNSGNLPARPQHAVAPAKGAKGIGGWLERNAQNIGGAVGGTIGGVLTAPAEALDAVTGVGGTALNIAGAAGGASIGGSIGQWLKNKLTGTTTNPLEEGAIQGATDVASGQLLKGGSALLKGVGSGLDNLGEHYAASQAKGLDNGLAGKAIDTFNSMRRYGVNSLSKFGDFADKVTGPDGIINNAKNTILGRAPSEVDVSPNAINDKVNSIITTTPGVTPSERKTATNLFNESQEQLGKLNGRGNLAQQNAADVFKNGQQVFEKSAASMSRKSAAGSQDPKFSAAADMYRAIADTYKGQIESVVGDTAVTKADKEQMVSDLEKAGVKNKNLVSDINGAKNYSDLRHIESTFVNASQIAKQTEKSTSKGLLSKMNSSTGVMDALGVGGALALHNPLVAAPLALTTKAAKSTLGPAMIKGADIADAIGKPIGNLAKDVISPTLKTAGKAGAVKLAAQNTKSTAAQSFTGTHLSDYNVAPKANSGPITSMVASQANQVINGSNQATNPQQTNPFLEQLTPEQVSQILATSGRYGLEEIQQQQSTAMALQKQEEPELSTEQQSQIGDITKALQGITDSSTLYEQANALGAGSGSLAQLGTHIPGVQNTKSEAALRAYDDNRGELAAQIATILGSGRSSAAMLKQIETELPSATDSPEAAQAKFSLVISRLNDAMKSTLATPATNTPGQLTNFAGQSVPGLNLAQPDNIGLLNFIGAQ